MNFKHNVLVIRNSRYICLFVYFQFYGTNIHNIYIYIIKKIMYSNIKNGTSIRKKVRSLIFDFHLLFLFPHTFSSKNGVRLYIREQIYVFLCCGTFKTTLHSCQPQENAYKFLLFRGNSTFWHTVYHIETCNQHRIITDLQSVSKITLLALTLYLHNQICTIKH